MRIILIFFILLSFMTGCAQDDVSGHVVRTFISEPDIPSTTPQKEAQRSTFNVHREREYEQVSIGQEFLFGHTRMRIESYEAGMMRLSIDDKTYDIEEGSSITYKDLAVKLDRVVEVRRDSAGMAKFIFHFGESWKMLHLVEQDKKAYSFDKQKYEISLDFIGTEDGEEKAIFRLNGQATSPLAEKEEFYFRDGSYIFVQEVMQGIKPRLIINHYFDISVKELEK